MHRIEVVLKERKNKVRIGIESSSRRGKGSDRVVR